MTKPDGKTKVSLATDLEAPVVLHWALSKEGKEWVVSTYLCSFLSCIIRVLQ